MTFDLWTTDWPTEDLGVVPAIVYGDRSTPETAHAAVLEADMPPAVFRDLAALVYAQEAVQDLVGEDHFNLTMARTLHAAIAEVLEVHQVEFIDHEVGWDCGCNEHGDLPGMPTQADALRHQADMLYSGMLPYIVALNHHAATEMTTAQREPTPIVIKTEGDAKAILDGVTAGFARERERMEQDIADLTQQTVDLRERLREESERSTTFQGIAQDNGRQYEQTVETLRLRSEALERVRLDRESAEADAQAARDAYETANEQMAEAVERAAAAGAEVDRLRTGIQDLIGELGAGEGARYLGKVASRLGGLLDPSTEHTGTLLSGKITCSCGKFETGSYASASDAWEAWDRHLDEVDPNWRDRL